MTNKELARCIAWLVDEGGYNYAKMREDASREFYQGRASMCVMICDKITPESVTREEIVGHMQRVADTTYKSLKH